MLGVLVFVHELGHFLAAKRVGIRVLKFQLGFNPTVLSFRAGSAPAPTRVHEWTVQLPCTTPASQQAILRAPDGVPASAGTTVTWARPGRQPSRDAAIIESRATTGRGLLADDGISISNLFTGDAPRASMTMSRLEVARGSRRTRQVFGRFLLRPTASPGA